MQPVQLYSGDKLLFEAVRFELFGALLSAERDGSFLPLARWTPDQQGWLVAPEAPAPLPQGRGLRQLSLDAKEPLRVSFHGDDGYEDNHYEGGRFELRGEERGLLALVNAGARIARLERDAELWQPFYSPEPMSRLYLTEWATAPLYVPFPVTARQRRSSLAAR
jgi:hypothetical protein